MIADSSIDTRPRPNLPKAFAGAGLAILGLILLGSALGYGGAHITMLANARVVFSEDSFGFLIMASMMSLALGAASLREPTLCHGLLVTCPIGIIGAWWSFQGVLLAVAIAGFVGIAVGPNLLRRARAVNER